MPIGNVLIIDDNKSILKLVSKFLESRGFACIATHDGRNGFNLIKTGNHDVVLLDVSMPDFSGIDVLEKLAKEDKIKSEKIILFTASSITEEEIDEFTKKGVYACLRKPANTEELLRVITQSIQNKEIMNHE